MPEKQASEENLSQLKKKTELSAYRFTKLPQEGSSKNFYRLSNQSGKKNYILMIANDKDKIRGNLRDWIDINKALNSVQVRTPQVYFSFEKENSLIMEDCKDLLLTEKVKNLLQKKEFEKVKSYYESSLSLLQKAQKLNKNLFKFRLCEKVLYNDLLLFYKQHIQKRSSKLGKLWNQDTFTKEAKSLCSYLGSLDTAFTHRDFHSKNILVHEDDLVLIDFQDACLGPKTYDLASLFLDPYTPIPMKKRREFLLLGLDQLTKELPPKETKEIKDSWKGMAIQRLYKILGSFNYLGSQKGKEKFLIFIKPTLEILSALDLTDSRWPFLTKELRKGLLPIESQK